MNHTLIVTDSASDILPEQESRYGIKVLAVFDCRGREELC